jgi:cation:H+ antiporter
VIADRSGIGKAITGGLFLGAATSLPGLVASSTAAWQGLPEMAVANAVGGIAAQTAFLGIADLCCRRGNLEHAAASLANLMQAGLLMALLTMPLAAMSLPEYSWMGVHPVSVVMVAAYCFGMRLSSNAKAAPMWHPHQTADTQEDEKEDTGTVQSWTGALLLFIGLGVAVGVAGWLTAETGIVAVRRIGLSESLVGGLFTAISSSLPELVTTITAVRNGAYTLAVGGIIGGNAFDTLFMAASDVVYREGSIYHHIADGQVFLIAVSILMSAILLMGLVGRERKGIANIGFESFGILSLYGLAIVVLTFLT